MGKIKMDPKKKAAIPAALLEDLLSIHPAIDVESGHITCHYETFSVLIAETQQGPLPLVAINNCLLLTAGEDNVNRLTWNVKTTTSEATIKPGGIIKVGSTEIRNPDVVEFLLSDTRLELVFHEVEIEDIGGGIVIVARPSGSKDGSIALIAIPCVERREEKREALHY